MSAEARAVLDALIDKIERQPDRIRSVQQRLPEAFASAEARTACRTILEDAARIGAVTLGHGRGEAEHILERVYLEDPEALYRFLGRMPAGKIATRAADELRSGGLPVSAEARQAQETIAEGWISLRRPFGFDRGDVRRAARFIAILDAACLRNPTDRTDMRTFSRLKTGHSKSIEEMARPIADFMRSAGYVDPVLDDDDVLKAMGLEKFPQPVLIAGPIRVGDADLSDLVYGGIAPEDAAGAEIVGSARSLLTIENFASFNRHVREARQPIDIVVYTGGFPSRTVLAALAAITARGGMPVRHWGDIDLGGINIALHLCRKLPVPVLPHLMDPEIARRNGAPGEAVVFGKSPIPDAWKALANFLQSADCHFLEQEQIDPATP